MQPIHPIDVIQHKRDGLALSDAEIQGFVREPFAEIAARSGVALETVIERIRVMSARKRGPRKAAQPAIAPSMQMQEALTAQAS